jgi:hypothetical protein
MYEIWANQENPSMRLIKPQGTPFPAPRSRRDWSLLGVARVSDAIAGTVEREGFDEVTSASPFDPATVFEAAPGAVSGRPDPL